MVNRMIYKMLLQLRNVLTAVMTLFKQVAGLTGISRGLIDRRMTLRMVANGISLALFVSISPALAATPIPDLELKRCENSFVARCAMPQLMQVATSPAPAWKLARAKGGKEAESTVSIMKTADTLHSDPDFAGLMVRCATQGKIDVLVVLVTPLPPKSRPRITIAAGTQTRTFDGTMAAAGVAVVLPDEAGALAGGPWQRLPALAVSVEDGANRIKGSVALDGLGAAYNNLVSSCAQ